VIPALLVVAGVLLALGLWFDRWAPSNMRKGRDGAHWATARDLRPLFTRYKGIELGYFGRRILRAEENANVLLLAPTGGGKTTCRVVPAILDWQGCEIVLTVKPRDVLTTLAARKHRGQVKVFDPSGQLKDEQTACWSSVAVSTTFTQAREIATAMLETRALAEYKDQSPHWRESARLVLASLLLAANHKPNGTMSDVLDWTDQAQYDEDVQQEIRELLLQTYEPRALTAIEGVWKSGTDNPAVSILSTLSTSIDAWREPAIDIATRKNEITAEWLCSGANTLYVLATQNKQDQLKSLFGAFLTYMIDGALELAQEQGGRLKIPLLLVGDELANVAPVPRFPTYASTGAGQGVLLLTVLQEYSRAVGTWGETGAASIVNNHRAKICWGGMADLKTLDLFEQLGGKEDRERKSRTRGSSVSTTTAEEQRPLVPGYSLRTQPQGAAALIYGHLPIAKTRQVPFDRDKRWRELAT
jgi:type IV secretion system protein VirD4